MSLDTISFFKLNSFKGFWTMVVYPFYLWMCFYPYLIANFIHILSTLFRLCLGLHFGICVYFPYPQTYSWNFSWLFFLPISWIGRVVHKKCCMHAFLRPYLSGRVYWEVFVLSLHTWCYCLRFYNNLLFPHLRMAYNDTSPCHEILNVFNFIC